jgi:hypothetical protein
MTPVVVIFGRPVPDAAKTWSSGRVSELADFLDWCA